MKKLMLVVMASLILIGEAQAAPGRIIDKKELMGNWESVIHATPGKKESYYYIQFNSNGTMMTANADKQIDEMTLIIAMSARPSEMTYTLDEQGLLTLTSKNGGQPAYYGAKFISDVSQIDPKGPPVGVGDLILQDLDASGKAVAFRIYKRLKAKIK